MRKFFTFTAALLASFSLWAAEPDFESFNWGADDFATVFADHDGLVISSDASAWKGNLNGTQYVALGGGTDMSAASPTPYFGVTAAAGIDSVEIYWCPNGGDATNLVWIAWDDAANFKQQEVDYKGEGPEYTGSKSIESATWQMFDFSATDETAILFGRQLKKVIYEGSQYQFGKNKTVNILGVRVWLHETKTVVSTVETLTNAKINGEPLDASDLSELISSQSLSLLDEYISAPTVTFTKHVVVTYDDSSTKITDVDVEVIAEEHGLNQWFAGITLNSEDNYSITMQKASAYTVTYLMMEGSDEIVLGTELVAAGGHPAEYAQYENRPLCSFDGWYDSDYIEQVDLSTEVINSDATYYAAFTKAYVYSINIEQLVMTNGKGYDIRSAFNDANIDYKDIDQLDSLNNSKGAARNEPYLGLKIKKQGGYIACNMMPGQTIRIKFGYVKDPVNLIVNNETTTLTPENNTLGVVEYSATEDTYLKIQTTTKNTVVIKQIMADDEQPGYVLYPINYAPAENGSVSGWTVALPGEQVFLTFAPAENYIVMDCHANDFQIIGTPGVQESFIMPAAEVTVTAVFSLPTAIERTEENMNAVKALENGQLIIRKNGVKYNAQGARF